MENLHQSLQQLIVEACKYPIGSRERQKNLTKIIRLINFQLWQENTPYYEDALQQTWIYFCQNLCESITGQAYDVTRANVITWLNVYLKKRLQDSYINAQKQQTIVVRQTDNSEINSNFNVIENIPANPPTPSLLEEIKEWVILDSSKKLSTIYLKDRPDITCQVLILRRLPPETPWKILAEELGVSIGTLSSFYQRHCLPLLREFGKSQGYL